LPLQYFNLYGVRCFFSKEVTTSFFQILQLQLTDTNQFKKQNNDPPQDHTFKMNLIFDQVMSIKIFSSIFNLSQLQRLEYLFTNYFRGL